MRLNHQPQELRKMKRLSHESWEWNEKAPARLHRDAVTADLEGGIKKAKANWKRPIRVKGSSRAAAAKTGRDVNSEIFFRKVQKMRNETLDKLWCRSEKPEISFWKKILKSCQ